MRVDCTPVRTSPKYPRRCSVMARFYGALRVLGYSNYLLPHELGMRFDSTIARHPFSRANYSKFLLCGFFSSVVCNNRSDRWLQQRVPSGLMAFPYAPQTLRLKRKSAGAKQSLSGCKRTGPLHLLSIGTDSHYPSS